MIDTTTVEEVKRSQEVQDFIESGKLARIRACQLHLSQSACRQEIYAFFNPNFNFNTISVLSKRERIFIALVINGKKYGKSVLRLNTPSVKTRVSDYMLAFGDLIKITFNVKEDDPMLK